MLVAPPSDFKIFCVTVSLKYPARLWCFLFCFSCLIRLWGCKGAFGSSWYLSPPESPPRSLHFLKCQFSSLFLRSPDQTSLTLFEGHPKIMCAWDLAGKLNSQTYYVLTILLLTDLSELHYSNLLLYLEYLCLADLYRFFHRIHLYF